MSRRNTDNRTKRGRAKAIQIKQAREKAKIEERQRVEARHKKWLKDLQAWEDSLQLKKKLVERETGEWWAYHIKDDGTLLSKRIKELWPREALAQRQGLPSPRFGKKPELEAITEGITLNMRLKTAAN